MSLQDNMRSGMVGLDKIPENQAFAGNIPGYDPSVRAKGRISTIYDVWCGRCGMWEHCTMESLAKARECAKAMGWKFTKKYGWVCPSSHKRDE